MNAGSVQIKGFDAGKVGDSFVCVELIHKGNIAERNERTNRPKYVRNVLQEAAGYRVNCLCSLLLNLGSPKAYNHSPA